MAANGHKLKEVISRLASQYRWDTLGQDLGPKSVTKRRAKSNRKTVYEYESDISQVNGLDNEYGCSFADGYIYDSGRNSSDVVVHFGSPAAEEQRLSATNSDCNFGLANSENEHTNDLSCSVDDDAAARRQRDETEDIAAVGAIAIDSNPASTTSSPLQVSASKSELGINADCEFSFEDVPAGKRCSGTSLTGMSNNSDGDEEEEWQLSFAGKPGNSTSSGTRRKNNDQDEKKEFELSFGVLSNVPVGPPVGKTNNSSVTSSDRKAKRNEDKDKDEEDDDDECELSFEDFMPTTKSVASKGKKQLAATSSSSSKSGGGRVAAGNNIIDLSQSSDEEDYGEDIGVDDEESDDDDEDDSFIVASDDEEEVEQYGGESLSEDEDEDDDDSDSDIENYDHSNRGGRGTIVYSPPRVFRKDKPSAAAGRGVIFHERDGDDDRKEGGNHRRENEKGPLQTPTSKKTAAAAAAGGRGGASAVKTAAAAAAPVSLKKPAARAAITAELYEELNERIFDNRLPEDLSVTWNKRLLTTAGLTKLRLEGGSNKKAEILLSEKVLDNKDRLASTLLHEMCHAAAWLLDGERKPPHGPAFWKWGEIAHRRIPSMKVSTCHNYEIYKPHQFRCVSCDVRFHRHSKKGLDVVKFRCGKCKGQIEYVGSFDANGTPKKARQPTAFSMFVKENFAVAKSAASSKGKDHKFVMSELSRMFKEAKISGGGV